LSSWEHFPKAPIVEAVLDIQVTFSSPVDLSRLEAFQQEIVEHYPIKMRRVRLEAFVHFQGQSVEQAVKHPGPDGFMFKSKDGQRTIQARLDGYTLNWLKPYADWESLRGEARKHWERYRDAFHPQEVRRLGLRYVNRVEIPLPFNDFREYIKTAPEVAEGLPQGLSALFMRIEVPDPNRQLLAIITEIIEPPIEEPQGRLPFILDIDIVKQANFGPDSPAIWDTFERMRDYKNEIFFNSLTERAKEMFR
jgi:uncharacterized protein (TIGR04255 family)